MIDLKPDRALVAGLSKGVEAILEVPGDKSISHRVIILGSLAEGKSLVSNMSLSRDNMATIAAFRKLGINIKKQNLTGDGKDFAIYGAGLYGLKEPESIINTANSGTLTRLLAGILAGNNFFSVLSGDKYLNRRPMKRVIEPLSLMGAKISGRGSGSYPPVAINGGKLKSIYYEVPVPSAQVKSCIMLAALYAEGNTVIYEKKATRDHTENLLKLQGCPVIQETPAGGDSLITVKDKSGLSLKPFETAIPGDFSSAAFFIALGILLKDSDITVKNVLLNEKRAGMLKVLKMMGADIGVNVTGETPERVGNIRVRYSGLKGIAVPSELVSDMIDEFPIFSVIASFAEGKTLVSGAGELRVKESDRIKTAVFNLSRIGVAIKEFEDGFEINGNPDLINSKSGAAVLNSFGDHRIAMSMIIMGLALKYRKIEIRDIKCINTSFPEFFDTVSGLTGIARAR